MNLVSHLLQRLLKLPPPATRSVSVQRDLRVSMADGVELLADRWVPRGGAESLPTALIRTPYGRRGLFAAMMARPLAERGFQVVLQSTRGGFGSGGTFDPLRQERADGLATLDWLIKQPWFGGSIVLVGMSYMGYVQWAVADSLPPEVKALIPQNSESALTLEFLRKDGMSLETPFGWGVLVGSQERSFALLRQPFQRRRLSRAIRTLPLRDSDTVALGHRSQYIQDVLAHDASDPHWQRLDHSRRAANVTVPVSSIGGWYDIFLPGQIRDFRALVAAGKPARLTIGPWTHVALTNVPILEAIDFGLAHARGAEPKERAPVRLFVMGEEAWRDFDAWPPSGYAPRRFHLHAGGALAETPPPESAPDRYGYDPADPTPSVGGARMPPDAGRVDNAKLEARADVLKYTTGVLEHDVEVVGEIGAEIWFRSSVPYADVFVRLCDVDERGRSANVCDGLVSLSTADTPSLAAVRLWPTAHRFKRGHRIRVQVSSGAFPRYARNHGTGEPRATATRLVAAAQFVYHDPAHASAIILPVRG